MRCAPRRHAVSHLRRVLELTDLLGHFNTKKSIEDAIVDGYEPAPEETTADTQGPRIRPSR